MDDHGDGAAGHAGVCRMLNEGGQGLAVAAPSWNCSVPRVADYGPAVTVGDAFLHPSEAGPARTRDRGQPLDMARDKAIAAAVFQLLAEVGYRGLTMDEVALTAGVGKAAIYRRWSSKEDLLVSFLEVASKGLVETPDTGSLRGDLLAYMTSTADVLAGTAGRATRAVIGAMADEPAIADAYRRSNLPHWDGVLSQILERAAQRGEVAPDAINSLAAHAGSSIFLQFWYLRGHERLDESMVTAVVDQIMIPLLAKR